jgi:hypothetical protein
LLTYLSSNKTRLAYHWPELWRALLTLTRFLTTYSADLSAVSQIHSLTTGVIDLLAFCISAGDTFLPDPSSYDDLFYKVVEAGPILSRFREVYHPGTPSATTTSRTTDGKPFQEDRSHSIDTLVDVSNHFHSLLFLPTKYKGPAAAAAAEPPPAQPTRKKNLSPREVHQIIKQGYETLSIRSHESISNWEKWREADWKPQLKRITRVAVEDATSVVSSPGVVHVIGRPAAATALK